MIFLLQNGKSPLWTALDKAHLDLVKKLIQAGANVNQTNKVGIKMHCVIEKILLNFNNHLIAHCYIYFGWSVNPSKCSVW